VEGQDDVPTYESSVAASSNEEQFRMELMDDSSGGLGPVPMLAGLGALVAGAVVLFNKNRNGGSARDGGTEAASDVSLDVRPSTAGFDAANGWPLNRPPCVRHSTCT
jgi:hypothetical protein